MSKVAGITNESVIPTVESRLFDGQASEFAVGMLAVGDTALPGLENEFQGYLRLRANVYADQANFIPKDLVLEDGTERDVNDGRSVHFGIIEKAGNNARVLAAMRLIVKAREDDSSLPVEDFFPEVFETPAPGQSTEVSRYICRYEDLRTQHMLKWPLFSSALSHVISHDLGPTYAIVEERLERNLSDNQVPIQRLGDPKFIEEYNSDNLPIVVSTDVMARRMQAAQPGLIEKMREAEGAFTYFDMPKAELKAAA